MTEFSNYNVQKATFEISSVCLNQSYLSFRFCSIFSALCITICPLPVSSLTDQQRLIYGTWLETMSTADKAT